MKIDVNNRVFSWKLFSAVLLFGLSLVLFSACTPKKIVPMELQVEADDKLMAEFPPENIELAQEAKRLLSLVVSKDDTITESRFKQIIAFIEMGFSKFADISSLPQKEVQTALMTDAHHGFQPQNVAEALALGKEMDTTYVAQLRISLLESKVINNIDRFKAKINLTVFTTNSGQIILSQDVLYNSNLSNRKQKDFQEMIQTFFPLRAYILQTRGGHQVAKISIGRSLGIKLGREFLIRDRKVDTILMMGMARKTISFSSDVLAKGTVIKVLENESWLSIPQKDRHKIRIGQAAFSEPDSADWY